MSYVPQSKYARNKHYYVDSNDFLANLEKTYQELEGQNNFLLLNYPNNPTGTIFTRQELQDIATVSRKYGVYILSDEIYYELTFKDEGHSSIAEFYPEKTIITNGASKWIGAGGWRMGFMIVPKEMPELVK